MNHLVLFPNMRVSILCLALFGLMATPLLYGQSDTGHIRGTVTDATNAIIPNATVTLKNEKTGQSRKTAANENGTYAVTQLEPATYTVTAEAAGMAPAQYTGVTLQVGQERTLNIVVQPAAVATEITVSGGDLAALETSSASIGGNVSAREVAELPINGRQISQLYLMTPGAVNFGSGTFDDVRFNGRSFEENALRYDGIEAGGIITNNPSNIGGEINGVFRLQSSMENVQEFRVDATNYPAEFGTGSGGQISVITKSGGNGVHGGLFEYFRNNALDARNQFDGASPSLPEGSYTANATQPSSLSGNPDGTSNTVSFVVHTAPPTVNLNTPPTPSGNANPSFSGSASDTTQVTTAPVIPAARMTVPTQRARGRLPSRRTTINARPSP